MSKGQLCPTSSSTENSPGGVVETETGETDGSDWGPGDDVTVTEEGEEEGGKGRERFTYAVGIQGIPHYSN